MSLGHIVVYCYLRRYRLLCASARFHQKLLGLTLIKNANLGLIKWSKVLGWKTDSSSGIISSKWYWSSSLWRHNLTVLLQMPKLCRITKSHRDWLLSTTRLIWDFQIRISLPLRLMMSSRKHTTPGFDHLSYFLFPFWIRLAQLSSIFNLQMALLYLSRSRAVTHSCLSERGERFLSVEQQTCFPPR